MAFLTQKKFDFVSSGLVRDTFGVVRFRGSEGFSKCYEFEIDLVSTEAEIDLDQVLRNPATFTILREEGDIPFHGILAEFEQLHQVDEYVFYRAVLVPKLWWLSLTHHNQVFLDKKVPEVLAEVLKDGGLTTLDFELRLQGNYPQWEYVCQYRESHLDFVTRWMEREGMYYYFEQGEGAEKLIITDTKMAHSEMEQGKTMYYSPPSGLDESHREEVVKSFVCRQRMLPKTLRLKDYNYRTPSLDLSGSAEVKSGGRGEVYIYGEHFRTPEEGNGLAKVRAEELLCQEKRFYGESTIPYLRPGFLFELQDHYRSGFNQTYLTVELEHEGSQTGFLLAGIQKGLSKLEEQPYYRNSFVTIPGNVQYRSERKTEKARFYGAMNARIDAAGSGKYAELDDHGRYKVLLPFDLSGRNNGKGSTWLRMSQPYAGTDHGMHFPLHKGTEVLLTFIDGDPDRPAISGAVPNPETPSPVNTANPTMSNITTASGNKIHMEDQEGNQGILFYTPAEESFLCMGSPIHPAAEDVFNTAEKATMTITSPTSLVMPGTEDKGFHLSTDGNYLIRAEKRDMQTKGDSSQVVGTRDVKTIGMASKMTIGMDTLTTVGTAATNRIGSHETFTSWKTAFIPGYNKIAGAVDKIFGTHMTVVSEEAKVAAEKKEMIANQALLAGTVMKLKGDMTDINGRVDKIDGSVTEVAEVKTEVVAEETSVVVEEVEVGASFTRMVEEETSVVGEEIEMMEMRSSVLAEETSIIEDSNEVVGTKIIV